MAAQTGQSDFQDVDFRTRWTKAVRSSRTSVAQAVTVRAGEQGLQESFRDFLAVEKENTGPSRNEEVHVITVICPLSKELATFEGHLWSRLDPILDREQQNIFRLNLQL